MENQKKTSSKYAPEVREPAVRTVFDNANQYASKWEAVCSIAAKIGCSAETLRKWVRQAERDREAHSARSCCNFCERRQGLELWQVSAVHLAFTSKRCIHKKTVKIL
jgi:transposase-like protein